MHIYILIIYIFWYLYIVCGKGSQTRNVCKSLALSSTLRCFSYRCLSLHEALRQSFKQRTCTKRILPEIQRYFHLQVGNNGW
jgi:hypothetical protein